jgi:hypothetical protein
MPNHITTQVRIGGTEAKIKKLIKDTKIKLDPQLDEGDNQFDFNGIVKEPAGLSDISSPVRLVETQAEADFKNNEDRERAEKNGHLQWHTDSYLSQAESDRRIKEYGANNWYDWRHTNWGTKWNAYDVHYTDHKYDGKNSYLVIQINTAWDTPRELWDALEDKGYSVDGILYGEMDGFEVLGNGENYFDAYQEVTVEYRD